MPKLEIKTKDHVFPDSWISKEDCLCGSAILIRTFLLAIFAFQFPIYAIDMFLVLRENFPLSALSSYMRS